MADFLSRQFCWSQITNAGDRMTKSSRPVLLVVEGHAFEIHFEGEYGLQKSGEAHNAWGRSRAEQRPPHVSGNPKSTLEAILRSLISLTV